ncbi:uncharacterized protein HaLaN_09195, partial [Haematococcus lacustris]
MAPGAAPVVCPCCGSPITLNDVRLLAGGVRLAGGGLLAGVHANIDCVHANIDCPAFATQDTPEQVTLHLLTRLRKPDPESLATLLRDPGHWPPSPEQERCRILSSLQLGSTCMQRVALTACTGEEAVFM